MQPSTGKQNGAAEDFREYYSPPLRGERIDRNSVRSPARRRQHVQNYRLDVCCHLLEPTRTLKFTRDFGKSTPHFRKYCLLTSINRRCIILSSIGFNPGSSTIAFNHFCQDGFVIQKRGNFFRKIHIQYRNIPSKNRNKIIRCEYRQVTKMQGCNYLKKKITG